jgi:hypothetical protein
MTTTAPKIPSLPANSPDWIALVREKVEGLRYGVVQLVVHEGRVTQIERTEKTRLVSPPAAGQPDEA